MRSELSSAALADLDDIGDYIARDSPMRALSFTDELLSACSSLADHPYAWSLIPEYRRSGLRRRPYGSYVVIYRVMPDHVDVLRILHGSRDLDRALKSVDRT